MAIRNREMSLKIPIKLYEYNESFVQFLAYEGQTTQSSKHRKKRINNDLQNTKQKNQRSSNTNPTKTQDAPGAP